jgi:hypothetical protein
MSDKTQQIQTYEGGVAFKSLRDMGNGTHAEVLAASVAPVNTAAKTVTFAAGESLSNEIDLGVARAGAILTPAAWTAASLTALVSHDGVTYSSLYDSDDIEWAVTTANMATGRARTLPLTTFLPYRFLKFRSGTAALAVAQAAARTLYLIVN